ncbi:MAG TPA: beta-propeller fold lactonase family protein [Pyrinomonadaceae bacterium]|nr:beta-propeller fold lactonase family protein [Pyrinomonadaceae bacterium]
MRFSVVSFCLVLFLFLGSASFANAGFVYSVVDDSAGNMLYGFSADDTTGELTMLSGFPIATGFNGGGNTNLEHIAFDPVNKFLFVANRGSSNISVFSVDQATGALTPASFSPIASVANQRTLKVHPSGSPLIVGADSFASFVITPTSATHAPGSPYALPTGVSPAASALSPDGTYYYAGGNSGNFFAGYSINSSTGEMTPIAGNPFDSGASNPVPVDVDSTGRLWVYGSRQSAARVYTLASGVPTAVTGSPFTYGETGFASVGKLHPNGNFLILPNRTRSYVVSAAISGSGASTTLTTVAGSPFGTSGTTSLAGAYNSAGTYLYVVNGGSRNITKFAVDPSTGVLSSATLLPANTMGTAGSNSGIVFVPSLTASAPISIGGRVLKANGAAVAYARVTIEGPNGFTLSTLSTPFGYYSFDSVLSNQAYTISVRSKLAFFTPVALTPTANVADFDITESTPPTFNDSRR